MRSRYDRLVTRQIAPRVVSLLRLSIVLAEARPQVNRGINAICTLAYVPFGCGKYVINHCSLGTPSGVINLLAALNQTPENDYERFDDLFAAYCSLVDRHVEAFAKQEKMEYDFAGRTAPFFFYILLMDDCLSRGKPLLQDGVRRRKRFCQGRSTNRGNAVFGKIFDLHGSFISSVISASFLLWLSYHSVLTLMSLPSLETTTVPFSSVR